MIHAKQMIIQGFTTDELIAELKRRNLALHVWGAEDVMLRAEALGEEMTIERAITIIRVLNRDGEEVSWNLIDNYITLLNQPKNLNPQPVTIDIKSYEKRMDN